MLSSFFFFFFFGILLDFLSPRCLGGSFDHAIELRFARPGLGHNYITTPYRADLRIPRGNDIYWNTWLVD